MFHSTLDQFEASLDATAAKLKHDLCMKIDQRVAIVKQSINRVRSLGPDRRDPDYSSLLASSDGPSVEIVSFEQYAKQRREQRALLQANIENDLNASSTSRGTKRKSSATTGTEKRRKTNLLRTDQRASIVKKHACKFNGCGKMFSTPEELKRHERMHLKVRPFNCTWPECSFDSSLQHSVIRHIRVRHFKLPLTIKEQREKNIEDDRNPNDYVQVNQDLLDRRLE